METSTSSAENVSNYPNYVSVFCARSPRYLVSQGKIDKTRSVLLKHHVGGEETIGAALVEFELEKSHALFKRVMTVRTFRGSSLLRLGQIDTGH